jgi:hypothetical protein
MSLLQIGNTADWHATMAMKAYRKKQYDAYRRHITSCDSLRYLYSVLAEGPQDYDE